MSSSQLHDIGAVLALIAAAGVLLLVVVRIVPSVLTVNISGAIHRYQLWLAALVAGTASLGSLWFSENFDWQPCRFCWFQRIFMYSSAVVLVVAALRRDRGVKWYVVPLASFGLLVSLWHNLIEHRVVEESTSCSSLTSCANPYDVSFGTLGLDSTTGLFESSGVPITLAVMAFCAFAAIIALLLLPEALDTDPTLDTNITSGEHS
jgi:disulfide bond formation protein DsbB